MSVENARKRSLSQDTNVPNRKIQKIVSLIAVTKTYNNILMPEFRRKRENKAAS